MKICPLVSQASILDDRDLLVHELDEVEPAAEDAAAADSKEPEKEDEIFINPESRPHPELSPADGLTPAVPIRFLAKSYRGRVECLGELCRFHDDETLACRIDRLIAGGASRDDGEILDGMKKLREASEAVAAELAAGVARRFEELAGLIRSTSEEKQKAIEAISLTLDAKTDEIERKIDSGGQVIESFRGEVSGWREALAKNIENLESGLGEDRKLVRELTDNHTGIMNLVEGQKKSIEEEEKKRRTTEARLLNNGGVMSYHNGQYEKALDLFKKAIDIDPTMTEAYNNLGLTYTEINEEEKATEAFKRAISLSPELAAAYNNLGYVFYRLGSYREAIEMYNEAIGRSKDSSSAYTNLGNAYYKLEKIEDAIGAWKKALALDPANEKARRNLKRFHAEVK
jgi:tetratricopeptide (TPR) repeat protein